MAKKPIIRDHDPSSHGGYIIASGRVSVNGLDIARHLDLHVCPIDGHGTTPVTATTQIQANSRPLIRQGDTAQCGAVMMGGSPNVIADL